MSVEITHTAIAFTYVAVWMLISQLTRRRTPVAHHPEV
jgi:hypothetical protein